MSTAYLLWGVLFSSIGLGYFMYGGKKSNKVIRYTGLALMLYPYFVGKTMILVLVGVGLLVLPRSLRL